MDAEDIVSEVFTRVTENIDEFRGSRDSSTGAWIFTIARNLIVDFYRAAGRAPHMVTLDEVPTIRSTGAGPEDQIEAKERFLQLRGLLQELSPRQREVISLRIFGRLRNKEIARVLQIEERTVSSHFARGAQRLRDAYVQMYKPFGDGDRGAL